MANNESERIISFIAHPDDEAWGNAGMLAKRAQNTPIDTVQLTDGNGQGIGRLRAQEQRNMMDILGMKEYFPVGLERGFKDGHLYNELFPSMIQAVVPILDEALRIGRPYTEIDTIGVLSGHGDHFFVDLLGKYFLRERPEIKRLVEAVMKPEEFVLWPKNYFVPVPIPITDGTIPFDIAETRPLKVKAIQAHASQMSNGGADQILRVMSTPPIELYRYTNRV